MQRVTLTLDDDLLSAVDALAEHRGYASRSEAVRDLLRSGLGHEDGAVDGDAYAALTYVFDHHKRDLAKRLLQAQHDHHDLAVAAMHVHLDHETCLETVVLHGPRRDLIALSHAIISQRGVRHGALQIIPGTNEGGVMNKAQDEGY
ncbi:MULTISPECIES: nickel-responsive transcriptional regulator NikR [Methylobacterium]|uniref:Putative nickel-responsive regulator n=1 Tax=Methylobacterium jeotgali TaxID=381630 RepID=A0ABQ4SVI8_9HYPH|nr:MULTISPECIES: nickel-responsive transcriptional regulator NikR [Methylobacterium]PIU05357.1 MAG: nickel-responsive transcriptional regulator NikR [Methylobacterium sp. CG09_land_8_20_14_0_10_71_15]PIU12181.1 MAG: nickel-responsive transcriptional regulator NikR [Methylobacterium sp. CG08_land_8_20_14_0_20_71_15]GJE06241.1 Nickel-responsive regulator [Methylobacterium jeotgali]